MKHRRRGTRQMAEKVTSLDVQKRLIPGTDRKQRVFLAAYAMSGSIKQAATAAKCSRAAHYLWLHDPAYAGKFATAHAEACESLEAEARRRAFKGSDTLLIFLLKAAKPDKYRDRWKGEVSGSVSVPVTVDLSKLDDSDIDRLRTLAIKAAGRLSG